MIEITQLFSRNGDCIDDYSTLFDDNGDLIHDYLISSNYQSYPPESDIVKMHYAQLYANETKGNYSALKLYERARD